MGTYPCFYYSTYQGFTNLTVDSSQTDLTDTALWSQTAPEDLADVTAIVGLHVRAGGGRAVLCHDDGPGELLGLY